MFKLLSTANPKTLKGEGLGYVTYILHLSPYTVAGVGNVCPKATPGCAAACLNTAGRGGMFTAAQGTNAIQEARKRKTRWFFADREGFLAALREDIARAIRQAVRHNKTPVFRLNGTSDITWEKHDVIQRFPDVQFYDYTKILGRKNLPKFNFIFVATYRSYFVQHSGLCPQITGSYFIILLSKYID